MKRERSLRYSAAMDPARPSRLLAVFALLLLALPTAFAGQWADLPYGSQGHPRQTLDLHVPDEPGRHPVVVYVPGSDWRTIDKRRIGNRALELGAAGFAVAAIDYRPQPDVDWQEQVGDIAESLAFLRSSADRLGVDARSVVVHAEGSGAHLVALLLTRPEVYGVTDEDLRAIAGLIFTDAQGLDLDPARFTPGASVPAAMRSTEAWIERSPMQSWTEGQWPALFLGADRDDAGGPSFAERLRERGAAVTERRDADPDERRDLTAAWLKSIALGRIQRFEQMDMAANWRAGATTGATDSWSADRAGVLASHGGVLYAGLDGTVLRSGPTRLIRKDGPGADWREEFRFPFDVRRVDWLGAVQIGNASLLAAASGASDGSLRLWMRQLSGTWLSTAIPSSLGNDSRVRSVLSRPGLLLVMTEGPSGAIWRVSGDQPATLKVPDVPEVRFNGSAAGFAVADGQVYAAWNPGNQAGGLFRRTVVGDEATWLPQGPTDPNGAAQASALGQVAEADGSQAILIAHAGAGRILRHRPGTPGLPILEFEIGPALQALWGDGASAVEISRDGFVPGMHPETNEAVSVLGIGRLRPDARGTPTDGAHMLVRQSGGHYSIATIRDLDAIAWPKAQLASALPSPFIADQGRRWYFAGAGISERGGEAWVDTGHLNLALAKRGPWWDRAHNGHGFDLQKIGGQWALLFYSFGTDGTPTWWSALGRMEGDRFITADNGLLLTRQVLRDGQWTAEVDTARSGSVSIRFGLAPTEGACNDGTVRNDARALAEIAIDLPERAPIRWCIEPMQLRTAGNGGIDNNGIWTAGLLDQGWGLSVIAQGVASDSMQGAIAYYYDAAGQPRWALGSGFQRDGRATMAMLNVRNTCPECAQVQQQYRTIGQLDLNSTGACGEVALRASLDLRYPDLAGSVFTRANQTLQRLNESGCY